MYDFIVIGGGIVGLSTAWQLRQRQSSSQVLLLEKESSLAAHQSGRNSGVIHAGIYYEPGSLKAALCRQGMTATMRFCDDNGITFEQCGKLIVATDPAEHERMLVLYNRALQNGTNVELVDEARLREIEPNIRGVGAILSPSTGIVNYAAIAAAMAKRLEELGGEVRTAARVTSLSEGAQSVAVTLADGEIIKARYLIACGGLMADRLASMMGIEIDFAVIPYRGEYYQLPASMNGLVQHLIYPVPDPALPFLGVHLTRMIDGTITVGPNAVQAWKREGYGHINFSPRDTWEMLRYAGFWRASREHFKAGAAEAWNSLWKPAYLDRVRRYCPSVELGDLRPYPPGVRAQAVARDGTLIHDFLFAGSSRSLHVCNAPSPAATSAIPIGESICDKMLEKAGYA